MKKVFLLALVLMSSLFVYAQEQTVVEVQSKRGPYLTNRFFDNWFISAGVGVQTFAGENDWCGGLGERLTPAFDFSVGKWITPSVGVRLQYAGFKGKGWSNYQEGRYVTELDPDNANGTNIYKEKFNYMNLHADIMWNISNAIGGYKETRFWDFVPYAGFGWARSAGNGMHDNELGATLGLLNNLRLSNCFDLNLEAKFMFVKDSFDGVSRNVPFDGMGTVTLGLTYNFPVRGFQRASDIVVVDDNTEFINKINDLESMLQKAEAAREAAQKQLAAEQAKGPKVVAEPYAVVPEFAIFFNIGKSNITKKELINIEAIAKSIKEVPGVKFTLFASADKETGTPAYNQKLSEKRGEAVYKALTEKFGVNPEQLEVKAVGSSDQLYDGAAYNRVVVIREIK